MHEFITPPEDPALRRQRQHWRTTRRLTGVLLAIWLLSSWGLLYHARAWNGYFLGWPFSVWAAAQGLMLLDLLLVVAYAMGMRRLDAHYLAAHQMAAHQLAAHHQADLRPPGHGPH